MVATPLKSQSTVSVIVVGVADGQNGAPLPDAVVRLPDVGKTARTDWIGEARFRVPRGTHVVEVRRLGYAASSVTILAQGDSVGPVFMLERLTTSLDTVRVLGRWVPARLAEFEQRRRMGIGRFLTDSALEREGNRSVALVLSMRFPGIRAAPDPDSPGHYALQSTRVNTLLPHDASKFSAVCKVDVYLDGILYNEYDSLFPTDLAGVEFYTMGTAPPQYRRGTGACQVMLLWSKW